MHKREDRIYYWCEKCQLFRLISVKMERTQTKINDIPVTNVIKTCHCKNCDTFNKEATEDLNAGKIVL